MTISRRTTIVSLFLFAVVSALLSVSAAAQALDPTFRASVYGDLINPTGDVRVMKFQPDGKLLMGGAFSEVQGYGASCLTRISQDGTPDPTFNSPDFYSPVGAPPTILAIAIQPDGKILIGGNIAGIGSDTRPGIRRLNADGTLDTSFFVTNVGTFHAIYDIKVQTDGKILIGGTFAIPNSNLNVARLNSDGTNDTSFTAPAATTNVKDIEILTDGKILVLGHGTTGQSVHPIVRKLNPDGSADPSFTPVTSGGGIPEEMLVLPDGKLVISGNFEQFGAASVGRLVRVNADGSIDASFNPGGAGSNGSVNDIALRTDGKLIITGGFSVFNGNAVHRVARLNADGTFDNTFTNNGVLTSSAGQDVELLPDNRMFIGLNNSPTFNSVVRLSADGVFDSTFVVLITRAGLVKRVVQQPDGKVLVAGTFRYATGNVERRSLARFNADGSLDTGFVPFFNNTSPLPIINALAVQADGKILIGTSNGVVLSRLNSDGSLDGTLVSPFPTTSNVWDIVALPDGKMLVGGDMTISTVPYRFTRLNSNGTRDLTFNPGQPGNRVQKIIVAPDGKMLVAGIFTSISDIGVRDKIARYNVDGNLDPGFIPNTSGSAGILDLALQADGKLIAGGTGGLRLNANGSLDNTFNLTTNGEIASIEVLPDGKILIGGGFSMLNGQAKNGIARLNTNGSVDPTFTAIANKTVNDLHFQTDGKLLLGGLFTQVNGISNVRVARLLYETTPQTALFDYDGDGKADVSVFRASENRWYVFRSSDSAITQTAFAIAGDVPVPADYDGDRKTDIAIYRPSSGAWWYQSSLNGAQINVNWGGEAGDIPRPSDFDGDGKTDFVFFRPTNNFWYRISSTGTVSNVQFGLAGDKPVRGDFDGDGKSDVAIFRPSTGDWWYQSSINGAQLAVRWGISTDIPAPADFDGDGKTDFAVYRPSTGVWYVINSSTGSFLIGPFGTPEDKPVPADYDGDGKAELAVFRPSTGIWYQLRTSGGFFAMQFGIGTDTPTPNAYVP